MKFRLPLLLCMIVLIVNFSCSDDKETELPNYPVIPSIRIDSLTILKDFDIFSNEVYNLHIYSKYTDGDSNFGGNFEHKGEYNFNCVHTIYKKTKGVFLQLNSNPYTDSLFIPRLGTNIIIQYPFTVYPKNIYEGFLKIEVSYYIGYLNKNDTIKCTMQILDRDFNFSNISEIEKVIE
jgi:hypothetical protein